MGKMTWGMSAADIDNAEEFEPTYTPYEGPVPPRGVYRLTLKKAEVKTSSKGNGMVELLLEIAEPGFSEKKRFNGCPLWFYLVDTEGSVSNIKNFMSAIGGTGRHWAATTTTKDDRGRDLVTKFGNITMQGLSVRAELQRGKNQDGEPRAEIRRFLPKGSEPEPGSDDAGSADGEQAPF